MRTIYFLADNEGYLMSISSTSHRVENEIKLELPHDHVIFNDDYMVYKYEKGQLIADEEQRQRIIAEEKNSPSQDDLNALAMLELADLLNTGR